MESIFSNELYVGLVDLRSNTFRSLMMPGREFDAVAKLRPRDAMLAARALNLRAATKIRQASHTTWLATT